MGCGCGGVLKLGGSVCTFYNIKIKETENIQVGRLNECGRHLIKYTTIYT